MILGTAGHVDHGKTALVKALTGIDTDRLPEEKKRGITTELGFAHLTLPDGRALGVVDVPGHEKFVKAMAAGAGGVDLALLVVSADEGVMPQTREHVDICGLLGVRAGILVVTKADLLPGLGDGWLALLEADLRALTADTFLADAPLIPVSAKTGEGLDALKAEIAKQAQATAPAREGPAFLPVDRAFSLKGFGTVVTGTLLSGTLQPEEQVALLPALDGPYRIRSIQVHGAPVNKAPAGERVALNLSGVEADAVKRGMAVVRFGELAAARVLDVSLTLLPSVPKPLPRRSRQLLALGTAHVEVAVRLLDVSELRPGETCFAQLRMAAPVAALPNQRFILRGSRALEGRGATLAGGRVLTLNPVRRRKGSAEKLGAFAAAEAEARVAWLLTEAGYAGLTEKELYAKAGLPPKELTRVLELASARGKAVLAEKEARRFLGADVFAGVCARATARLEAFHDANPEADGLPREELRQKLGVPHEKTFARMLTALVDAGKIEVDGEKARLKGRRRALGGKATDDRGRLLAALDLAALQPPLTADLAHALKLPEPRVHELLKVLASEGAVGRAGDLWFSSAALKALEGKLVAHLEQHKEITTQQFKEMTGLSRKFLIPLAEYFDAQKVTLRVGEKRLLRKKA